MKVKEAKEQYSHFNAIEVYTPTDKINCTSTKVKGKYYKYSTNSDEAEVDFVDTEILSNTARIFTK
jgi:hypothetical protein